MSPNGFNIPPVESDEVYVQLFVVQLYTIHKSSHSARAIEMLEQFLIPSLDISFISATEQVGLPIFPPLLLELFGRRDSMRVQQLNCVFCAAIVKVMAITGSPVTGHRV